MSQITDKDKKISDIIRVLNKMLRPERIYLFGSRAAGLGNDHSDYDIAIEGHEGTFRDLWKTKEKLDRALGIHSFDLVELEKTGTEFNKLVREKGSVIYERD